MHPLGGYLSQMGTPSMMAKVAASNPSLPFCWFSKPSREHLAPEEVLWLLSLPGIESQAHPWASQGGWFARLGSCACSGTQWVGHSSGLKGRVGWPPKVKCGCYGQQKGKWCSGQLKTTDVWFHIVWLHLYEMSKTDKSMWKEIRWVTARGWGKRDWWVTGN